MTIWNEQLAARTLIEGKNLLVIAGFLGGALLIGAVAALGGWWLAPALVAALGVALLTLRWPQLAIGIVLFGLYMNLPVVAMLFHGLPYTLAAAFPLLLAVPLAIHLCIRREGLIIDSVFVVMIVFQVLKALSTIVAIDQVIAMEKVTKYAIEGLLIYLLVLNAIRREKDLHLAIWALLLAGALLCLLLVHQELTQSFDNEYGGLAQREANFRVSSSDSWRDRSAGPIGDPNYFAQILLFLVPLGLLRLWSDRSIWLRGAALGATALVCVGMALTFSRGGALGLLITLGLIVYFQRVRLIYVLLGGLAGLLLIANVAPDYFGRIQSITSTRSLVQTDSAIEDKAIEGRLGENLAAIYVFIDHPVLGVGPDNFPLYYQDYAEPLGLLTHADERPAHNLYLSIAAEMGLLGIGAFLLMNVIQLWRLYQLRCAALTRYPPVAHLATALGIGLISYLVTGVLLTLAYERYFWMFMALASAVVHVGWQCLATREEEQAV